MPRKGFNFGKKKRFVKRRGPGRSAEAKVEDYNTSTSDSMPVPITIDDDDRSDTLDENKSAEETLDTSRAEKKASYYPISSDASSDLFYAFISSVFISNMVSFFTCPHCKAQSLGIDFSERRGLAALCKVFCSVCDEVVWSSWTSPQNDSKMDINQRAVLACRETGITHTKFSSFLGIMSCPFAFTHKTYQSISKDVHFAAVKAADYSMERAAEVIQARSESQPSERTSSTGCPVITVSYDGTWHKRGHSSHTGVGVAIEFGTGLIVDAQVISNYCASCARGPRPDSPDYQKWYDDHRINCQANFDGSANAMEMEAARIIFSRSVRKRGLVYGTMLCDGDSKAFNEANKTAGYDIEIIKEDCINHIAKRMFNSLTTLKSSNKSELNRKLTQPNIEKITNVYAKSLKDNAPDVQKMKLAVLGSFLHMASTDANPNHRLCPTGEDSWCHFQRSMAKKSPVRPHTPTIRPEVSALVYPIIKRLSDPDLLSRCAKMGTQNANESFNSTIWRRCPKTEFGNKTSVEIATFLAVVAFNMGNVGLKVVLDMLGIPCTATNLEYFMKRQKLKVQQSRKQILGISKWKRKHAKSQRVERAHQQQQKEGTTYDSGGFNY